MKLFNEYNSILFLFFLTNIFCDMALNRNLITVYNKAKSLSVGSIIYFDKYGKCNKYSIDYILCLINYDLSIYGKNSKVIEFNIGEDFKKKNFNLELNVMDIVNSTYFSFLLTYIKDKSEIKFLHYIINTKKNTLDLKTEHSLNISSASPINKYINCQNELGSKIICFYCDINKSVRKIEFNFYYQQYSSKIYDNYILKYNESISDDAFIMASILNDKLKFFLCLDSNQDNFLIYAKNNFPPNYYGSRRLSGVQSRNDNIFNEIPFSCNEQGKLLSFFIVNRLTSIEDVLTSIEEEKKFYYFSETGGNLGLSISDNINSLTNPGSPNTIQIFFIKALNITNDFSFETDEDAHDEHDDNDYTTIYSQINDKDYYNYLLKTNILTHNYITNENYTNVKTPEKADIILSSENINIQLNIQSSVNHEPQTTEVSHSSEFSNVSIIPSILPLEQTSIISITSTNIIIYEKRKQ